MVFPATWLVLATLGIILVLFGMGYYWARTHGQFDDVERAKFAMLEDEGKETDNDTD
jgi:cbb3-type cytochrome oxidase maturation protein